MTRTLSERSGTKALVWVLALALIDALLEWIAGVEIPAPWGGLIPAMGGAIRLWIHHNATKGDPALPGA